MKNIIFSEVAEGSVDPTRSSFILKDPNDNAAFLPFGSGIRACVGEKFVIRGVATLFASLLERYEVCCISYHFFLYLFAWNNFVYNNVLLLSHDLLDLASQVFKFRIVKFSFFSPHNLWNMSVHFLTQNDRWGVNQDWEMTRNQAVQRWCLWGETVKRKIKWEGYHAWTSILNCCFINSLLYTHLNRK